MFCHNRLSKEGSEVSVSKCVRAGNEWHGTSKVSQIVSNLKANNIIVKVYLYYLVRVNELEQEVPSVYSLSIVYEFPDVFPENLPRIPPDCEIDFGVDLDPNTKIISIRSYRITPVQLKDLKLQL